MLSFDRGWDEGVDFIVPDDISNTSKLRKYLAAGSFAESRQRPEWQCNLSRYVPTSHPRGLIAQDSRGSSGGMQSFVMRKGRSPGWDSQDNEL